MAPVSCMCDDNQHLVALETVRLGISVYLKNIWWFLKTGVAWLSTAQPQKNFFFFFFCDFGLTLEAFSNFPNVTQPPLGAICQSCC